MANRCLPAPARAVPPPCELCGERLDHRRPFTAFFTSDGESMYACEDCAPAIEAAAVDGQVGIREAMRLLLGGAPVVGPYRADSVQLVLGPGDDGGMF